MSLVTILNSDVGSLRTVAQRGFYWWLGQLAEFVPVALRSRRRIPRQIVTWDDGVLRVVSRRGTATKLPRSGTRVIFAIPARLAFVRTLQLPRMSAADLRRMVEMEAERLSPLPLAESIVATDVGKAGAGDALTAVAVAVLPKHIAEQAIAALDEAGLVPGRIGLIDGLDRHLGFDFVPGLRERGLIASRPSPLTFWWSIALFAFLLNIAILVIRDRESVARLSAIADQQAPAVVVARAIEKRANYFHGTARDLVAQRRSHDVLTALAVISQALPAGAWVQRLTYDGRAVRLTGYKHKDVDLVAALKRDPRIGGVSLNSAQIVADIPAGQPFDLTVHLRTGQ